MTLQINTMNNNESKKQELLTIDIMYALSDLEALLQEACLHDLEEIITEVKKKLLNRCK